MKKLQWNMEEVFYFPENVGVPKDARLVKVKAGFTEKRSDDAVRLSGIYHIAAKVDFTEGQRSEAIPEDATFVDDVELDGATGYFEYAVPLYIDLPPEVEHPLHIEATDIKSTFDGQGSFTVAWNVNCMYGQAPSDQTVSKETAGNEADSKEKAVIQQQKQNDQASKFSQSADTQKQVISEPVHASHTTATHDSSASDNQDDILSYIAALPDEWTTTRFRSNDIFVKEES
ncbi:hypothetical protein [Sporosarcina sp. UB5]|uniref:hypothetical protein n=1 Tax=Sporosarcina sp. UB5 TaxID=3047463 RepID=UPI003D7AE59A